MKNIRAGHSFTKLNDLNRNGTFDTQAQHSGIDHSFLGIDVWIDETRNGNEMAFLAILEQFQPLIRKSLSRFHWYIDQDDLRQEATIALYNAVMRYEPGLGVRFPGYAASRVHYHVWNVVKKSTRTWNHQVQERRSNVLEEDGEPFDRILQLVCPHAACAYETIECHELFTILSERERLAAHYLFIERLKPFELAEVCGVSVETVKTWRKRAIQKLRKALEIR